MHGHWQGTLERCSAVSTVGFVWFGYKRDIERDKYFLCRIMNSHGASQALMGRKSYFGLCLQICMTPCSVITDCVVFSMGRKLPVGVLLTFYFMHSFW